MFIWTTCFSLKSQKERLIAINILFSLNMLNWKRGGAAASGAANVDTAPKRSTGTKGTSGYNGKGKGKGKEGKADDRRRDDRDDRVRNHDTDRHSRSGHSDQSHRGPRRNRDGDDDVWEEFPQADDDREWDEFAWRMMATQGKLVSMVCQRLGDVEAAVQRSWICDTADVSVAACIKERKEYSDRNRGKSGHGEGPPDQWVFKVFCETMVERLDASHAAHAPLKLLVDTLSPEQALVQVKTFRFKKAFNSKHVRLIASFHPSVDLSVGNAVSAALKHVGFPELQGRAPQGRLEGQLSHMLSEM